MAEQETVAEQEARKAATAAARAAWGCGHGCSHITGNRGGMRGRGGRGRGVAVGGAGTDADDSDLEPFEATESSGSSSDTSTVSEWEIPMPRSHQEHPIWVIRGHNEEVAENERIQPAEQLCPHPHPHPHPHPGMCNCPPESQDIREVEAEESSDMDVFEHDRPEALQAESGQAYAVGPEVRIGLVPGVMEDSLEMQGRDMGVPGNVAVWRD